ncbi:MAG: FAD-dependent oxidoreductase [Peptococcaceae bacterium]|nr:FAD-dependent oxidoreductase [Peptococcaceae bacterium]
MVENTCTVQKAEDIIKNFLTKEEYCGVCRRNFSSILTLLNSIREGEASREELDIPGLIEGLADEAAYLCHCGRGYTVAGEILFLLQENRWEFISHIEKRVCPSSRCPKLILAPCQAACPAGIDIPNYITLVGMGKYEEALELIREDVPLPGTLGRVCEHPCEKSCRRARVDRPISICALKRLAYDRAFERGYRPPARPERKHEEKVAVVGSGPAGLSCAYFLAKRGYAVTIFEAMPEAGGMLAYGIPPYRLPREVLRNEIACIEAMGVEIKLNSPISGERGINALKKEYDAVFLSTGAWEGSKPDMPGLGKLSGVLDGVTFLRAVNKELLAKTGNCPFPVNGKKIVVVGGGNVAIDAARVSLRLGAAEVRVVYRRTRNEMPALREEIEDAEREGIVFDYLVSPVSIGGEDGRVSHIECLRNVLSEPDESGRRRPVPVKNSEFKIKTDLVIFATGQQPALSYLYGQAQVPQIEVFQNRIAVKNPLTMETSHPGIFAGGDAVTGPATVVKAIAAGKRAAAGIDAYLRGRRLAVAVNPVKRKSLPPIQVSAEEKARPSRIDFHALYLAGKKNTFEEIVQRVGEEAAALEAVRCLRCDICIACGICVDNCRNKIGADAIHLGYINSANNSETDFKRPESNCIGCGTCTVNCPTGAITVEDREGFRELRMCGGLMSRLELVPCVECGRTFTTAKHLDYITQNLKNHFDGKYDNKNICPECARKTWPGRIYLARMGQSPGHLLAGPL